jgi:hypothetical protein
MSPFSRPRSPTPNDSRKASTNVEQPPTNLIKHDQTNHSPIDDNRARSPTLDNQQQKEIFEPPTAIISPPSRRESTNKTDNQQTSRPTSAVKTNFDDNLLQSSTNRRSTGDADHFTKTDEQLQIPTNDFMNERVNSPPPSPSLSGIKSVAAINPLLGSSLVQKEQDGSRPPSETNRKSPTTSMISNEKVIDGDVLPTKSRRESTISQQQINNTEQKPSR